MAQAQAIPLPARTRVRLRTAALPLGAVLLAVASMAVTETMKEDPEGWLRWARAVGLGEGTFSTGWYPSWKPLGLLFALPFAATGPAASVLWLVAMRAAGVLAIVLVARFVARRAGVGAGVVAASVLALVPGWWSTALGGGIEPAIVVLGCCAVAAHEQRRPGAVLALLSLMALGRQEALLLVAAYGLAVPEVRAAAAGAAALVVVAWLGGDWLGSGDPFHGGDLARAAPPEHPLSRFGPVHAVVGAVVTPVVVVLIAAGVRVARARRDTLLLALFGVAVAWLAADLALLALGYPLPPRFLHPAAAALAAVAGMGAHGYATTRSRHPVRRGRR